MKWVLHAILSCHASFILVYRTICKMKKKKEKYVMKWIPQPSPWLKLAYCNPREVNVTETVYEKKLKGNKMGPTTILLV